MAARTQVAYGIYTLPDFLSPEECTEQIAGSEKQGFEYATFNSHGQKTSMPRYRNNDRVFLEDKELANDYWQRGKDAIPEFVEGYQTIGISERFRIYRYHKGQFFKRHADGPHRRENGERSRLTFIVYLNDGYDGGETIFDEAKIEPKTGMALLFMHGLMHEGAEVLSGEKYILRTDVMCAADLFDPAE